MQQKSPGGSRVAGVPGHLPIEAATAVRGVADDGVAEPIQVSPYLVKPGTEGAHAATMGGGKKW